MKKLALLLALTSGAANATPNLGHWFNDELSGRPMTMLDYASTGEASYNISTIVRDDDQNAVVGFTFFNDTCEAAHSSMKPMDSALVNGTLVKMQYLCVGYEKGLAVPETKNGNVHIISQFKQSNVVKLKLAGTDWLVTAKGFTKLYNQVVNQRGGI